MGLEQKRLRAICTHASRLQAGNNSQQLIFQRLRHWTPLAIRVLRSASGVVQQWLQTQGALLPAVRPPHASW